MGNVSSLLLEPPWDEARPEELERANIEVIVSFVVLPGLAEADEAERPAHRVGDRELVVHVAVTLARVNDRPRAIAPVV